MHPTLRNTLIAAGAVILACWAGWDIAEGAYNWPTLLALGCVIAILSRATGVDADVAFLGILLVGYLVGNRGFAQLMPAPGVPILPAEACLLITVPWMLLKSAFAGELPLRRDWMNWAVLAWLAIGTGRVLFDLRNYGLLAVRDFAMVYYALFFFVAQHMARDERARRYILQALLVGTIAILPVFMLTEAFPRFFLDYLRFFGAPLIYFKGDLVFTFLMAGSVLIFHWAESSHRPFWWLLAVLQFLAVAGSDSRASLVGGLVAMALLLLGRHRKFPALQCATAVTAFLVVLLLAQLTGNPWAERKRDAVMDRLSSMTDLSGATNYRDAENAFKAGNNQFRLVWWKNVAQETWDSNPLLGLGFGYDLTKNFVREYSPELADDFSARSPHSIVFSAFGRMGVLGLLSWLLLCGVLVRITLTILRRSSDPMHWGIAVAPWVILVSACFGVVLEGPMGAVPFWVLLGLANRHAVEAAAENPPVKIAPASTASLPAAETGA